MARFKPARFKAVCLDLGGVVYIGNEPLPGAVDAVSRLRDAGVSLRFLTNTTRNPRARILAKLRDMGLPVEDDELFTPADAAKRVLKERGLIPHLLIHPALEEDFAGLPDGPPDALPNALIVGDCGSGFTYESLNRAYRVLESGAEFLALANNRNFRDADGGLSLDAGPFVAALAFASGKQPTVLGKPSRDFFVSALSSMACEASDAAMVGDDVENDVGGAMAAGMSGVLVRTGKYAAGDEGRIDPPPSFVAEDLARAVDWMLG